MEWFVDLVVGGWMGGGEDEGLAGWRRLRKERAAA
jgi:hypothetical protein